MDGGAQALINRYSAAMLHAVLPGNTAAMGHTTAREMHPLPPIQVTVSTRLALRAVQTSEVWTRTPTATLPRVLR